MNLDDLAKSRHVKATFNKFFFGGTALLALVALPLYAYHHGLTWMDWVLAGFMAITTMMATTFGHHRLFSHKAFKTTPLITRLNLFFGAAAWEGSVMQWASEHRNHHKFTDTNKDPYNIKQGFWYAHMGWFFTPRPKCTYENVKDLSKDPWIKNQSDYYIVWAIGAGIAFPMLVGLCYGSMWGAFFLAVCGRLFFIHHCVFLINSACHMFGKPTYDPEASPRDSWYCAILTNGEGYHSYHHRFPSDYRNGIKWYHWDPTKWLIRILAVFNLTWDLNSTPESNILKAKSSVK